MKTYRNKTFAISTQRFPPVDLRSVAMKERSKWPQRFSEATRRRFFTLHEDWQVRLQGVTFAPALNGWLTVPAQDEDGELIVFDGASVPLPWLVSFLSLGILRPLGVMLYASILHDYAFKYGQLKVSDSQSGETRNVPVDRECADALFREVISATNKLPIVAWLAWFFVRLGWIGVKYNGRYFGGKAPWGVLLLFTLGTLSLICWLFEDRTFQPAHFSLLVGLFIIGYLLTWLGTVLVIRNSEVRVSPAD